MPPLQIIDVSCNHCGATLQVDEKTRFVTCNYCRSRLAIQRSESAVFTEVLDRIEEHTSSMAENLELIRLQGELEQLDREWGMRRENMMVTGKNGSRSEPSIVAGVFTIVIGVVFAVIWVSATGSDRHVPAFFTLFGVLVSGMFVFGGITMIAKSGKLENSRTTYDAQRSSLVGRIEAERSQHSGGNR